MSCKLPFSDLLTGSPLINMARVSRLRAASRHYGATRRVDDLDALEASVLSMDTIKSEEQSAEFSCGECCQASTCVCVCVWWGQCKCWIVSLGVALALYALEKSQAGNDNNYY